MKIHFASLFCPEYDLDIMPEWCGHYLKYRFDTYTIWLHHKNDLSLPFVESANNFFVKNGMTVKIVRDGEFGNGSLRNTVIRNFLSTLPPDDSIVVADSDEIQAVHHGQYRTIIEENDIVWGRIVDRYALRGGRPALVPAVPAVPLSRQYEGEGAVSDLINRSIAALGGPHIEFYDQKSHILACRCNVPVDYSGSHFITDDPGAKRRKVSEGNTVYHYTWRDSKLLRMLGKGYYTSLHIQAVADFFGIDRACPELQCAIERDRLEQKKKGWE